MSLPDRIGRYEVVAPLTAGGMAEILLGRLVGPSGFERPVVIKRILPHLARIDGFVAMFLDEARIIAGIRHPNVVTVLELGQSAGELFLALEYLEGESVGSLARRLVADGRTLDPRIAAFVAAEACAGLHAAHELTDAAGRAQDIVHRDVSPQNVFVTYDGRVVVLDFGIATARSRLARTETGELKGKIEYMSPEQCLGEPVDRRTDVFALGVVLYELTTGTRLFKRNGQLAVLDAITREPVVAPSRLVDDYPRALDRVCMRALERAREDRYATAAEMRRDLLGVVRDLERAAPKPDEMLEPRDALAQEMTNLFADRAAEKQELLRRLRAGEEVTEVPRTEADDAFELASPPLASAPTRAERRRPRVRAISIAAGVAILGIGALALQRLRAVEEPRPLALALASALPPSTASAPLSAPPVDVAAPVEVALRVESRPAGARVLVAGVERGLTPLTLRLARGADPVAVELRRAGFVPLVENVVPDGDREVLAALQPSARAAPPPRPKPTATATASETPFKRFE